MSNDSKDPNKEVKNLPGEDWKPIFGYQGRYLVSNMGRVQSTDMTIPGKYGGTAKIRGRLLKITRNSRNGYSYVVLCFYGEEKNLRLSRLVLLAFVGDPPLGTQCCHNDGDKNNNKLGNLRWGTIKENCEDKRKHGKIKAGESHHNSKLTSEKIIEIRRLYTEGHNKSVLGRMFGVTSANIYAIVNELTWRNV